MAEAPSGALELLRNASAATPHAGSRAGLLATATAAPSCRPASSYSPAAGAGLAALAGLLTLFTVAGNVLVAVAVLTSGALRAPQNLFLVSLASADILVAALVMPFSPANELRGGRSFGPAWCNAYLALDVLLCTASIAHLCAVSLDRYWSVARALEYQRRRGASRAPSWPSGCSRRSSPRRRCSPARRRRRRARPGAASCATSAGTSWPRARAPSSPPAWSCRWSTRASAAWPRPAAARAPRSARGPRAPSRSGAARRAGGRAGGAGPAGGAGEAADAGAGRGGGRLLLCWSPFFFSYSLYGLRREACRAPETLFKLFFWVGYCNSGLNPVLSTAFNQDFRRAFRHILSGRRSRAAAALPPPLTLPGDGQGERAWRSGARFLTAGRGGLGFPGGVPSRGSAGPAARRFLQVSCGLLGAGVARAPVAFWPLLPIGASGFSVTVAIYLFIWLVGRFPPALTAEALSSSPGVYLAT